MSQISNLSSTIDAYPTTTVDWLTRLIRYDTTSSRSNLAMIKDIQTYLKALGLTPWLSYNAEKTKANLFVTVAAQEGNKAGGIILSGHTDVVPVIGQDWHTNPFVAEVIEGKLYGRGSCDMKGFIACTLAQVPQMLAAPLQTPIHLAFSFDEEVGCLGAPLMLEELHQRGLSPQYCIVGEPTDMQLVVAHKGINVYRCQVHGHSCHSSLTNQGVNAIEYAAKMIVFLNGLSQQIRQQSKQYYGYDVPYATLSTGTISGGTATNIVPNHCEFTFEYRNMPLSDISDLNVPLASYIDQVLQPQMQAIHPDAHIDIEQTESVPAMPTTEDRVLLDQMVQLLQDSQPTDDTISSTRKVAYATEAGLFSHHGIPTIICGPGNIEQAHKPDEYVTLEQLARCDRFITTLINQQCQS